MLRRHVDMQVGLVNGAMGTVSSFIYDAEGRVKEIDVKFDNGVQNKLQRLNIPFELMRGIYVRRAKFAVSLSYAVIIHMCQGLSLDTAIVDL